MKTLKTISSVLILALAIAGAAQADDLKAGPDGGNGSSLMIDGSVKFVSSPVNPAAGGVNVLMGDGSVKFLSSSGQSASDNGTNIINDVAQADDLTADSVRQAETQQPIASWGLDRIDQ